MLFRDAGARERVSFKWRNLDATGNLDVMDVEEFLQHLANSSMPAFPGEGRCLSQSLCPSLGP